MITYMILDSSNEENVIFTSDLTGTKLERLIEQYADELYELVRYNHGDEDESYYEVYTLTRIGTVESNKNFKFKKFR